MIWRRAMLAAMGGLPFSRPDQFYQPPAGGAQIPGARGLIVAREVILTGTGTSSGLFAYSPTRGANNLVASISPASGTDPYGNVVLAGVGRYGFLGGTYFLTLLTTNGIGFYTSTSQSAGWNLQDSISTNSTGVLQLVTSHSIALQALTNIIQANTAATPLLDIQNQASSATPILRLTTNALGDPIWGALVSGDTNFRAILDTATGPLVRFRMGPGNATPDVNIARTATGQLNVTVTQGILALLSASLDIGTVGQGLQVAEGTNAKQGTATLASGTATVANTAVTANSRIFLTSQVNGVTGALRVSARTAGTSFVITSSVATDAGLVAYEIFEPG